MKGLIRNNFYSMESNMKMAFVIAVLLALTPLLVKNPVFLPMIIAIQIFVFVANTGTSLHADETAKWNKYEITLPIKRSTVIGAKYVTFAILISCGLLMSVITFAFAGVSELVLNMNTIIWGYEYGIILAMTTTALMYPMMLKFGTEKSELIMLVSVGMVVGMMLFVAMILSGVTNGMNMRHPLVGAVSVVVSVLLFIGSYFVSLWIQSKKEF